MIQHLHRAWETGAEQDPPLSLGGEGAGEGVRGVSAGLSPGAGTSPCSCVLHENTPALQRDRCPSTLKNDHQNAVPVEVLLPWPAGTMAIITSFWEIPVPSNACTLSVLGL